METTCRNGHPWTNTTTYTWHGNKPYRRCPVCERARARLAWDARHAGHDVINTVLKLRGELSGRLIAQRIGISPRTVWRHLAAVRTGVAV
jgi:DNA-binding CsgD family transcriptional regulator